MNSVRNRRGRTVDIEHAKTTPADEFKQPDDVVKAPELSDDEKRKILNQWEVDAQALSRASDEGMVGGEPSRLTEVQAARRKVFKGGKHGSSADRRTSGKPQP
jgi:hypothetical protein